MCMSKRSEIIVPSGTSMGKQCGWDLGNKIRTRTMRGPSPKYFCTNSLPTTRMNAAVVWCATALASMVLPVPGGPYRSTPRGGSMPIWRYKSKCVSGNSTASRISCEGKEKGQSGP